MRALEGQFELVLGHRQIVRLVLMAAGLMAMVSATAYLSAVSTEPAPMIVEKVVPVAPPIEAVIAKAPEPIPGPAVISYVPLIEGRTYLQMAALDRGVADVFVEFLRRNGFPAVVAPGPDATLYRVLVGPLGDATDMAVMQMRLKQAGYGSFARKYQVPATTPAPSRIQVASRLPASDR
jgi:cell division septation protein DedD